MPTIKERRNKKMEKNKMHVLYTWIIISSGMWGKTSLTVSAMASMLAMLSFEARQGVLKCKPPALPRYLIGTGGVGEREVPA